MPVIECGLKILSVFLNINRTLHILGCRSKRKKPNIFFIVLVFLMIGAMIVCDIMYYVQVENILALPELQDATKTIALVRPGQTYVLVQPKPKAIKA